MTIFERYREIIPDFSSFQESLKRALPVHLRVNRLKVETQSLVSKLMEKGVLLIRASENHDTFFFAPDTLFPGRLLEYYLGQIHPQALTSCLVSIALSPAPGSIVLDMCAAPGGKTSHLAEFMNNTGLIIANELHTRRYIALGHTLARLGVLNTVLTAYPAQEFPQRQLFDFILADVPCSGEGRFRKLEGQPLSREDQGGYRLVELQKKIIIRGFDLLSPDGKMLYATCTYNPEENESIIDYLLKNRDAELLPLNLGIHYAPAIMQWGRERYHEQLRKAARFYPHQIDSVGFFMAKIGRRR